MLSSIVWPWRRSLRAVCESCDKSGKPSNAAWSACHRSTGHAGIGGPPPAGQARSKGRDSLPKRLDGPALAARPRSAAACRGDEGERCEARHRHQLVRRRRLGRPGGLVRRARDCADVAARLDRRHGIIAILREVTDLSVRTTEAGSYLFPKLPPLALPLKKESVSILNGLPSLTKTGAPSWQPSFPGFEDVRQEGDFTRAYRG